MKSMSSSAVSKVFFGFVFHCCKQVIIRIITTMIIRVMMMTAIMPFFFSNSVTLQYILGK